MNYDLLPLRNMYRVFKEVREVKKKFEEMLKHVPYVRCFTISNKMKAKGGQQVAEEGVYYSVRVNVNAKIPEGTLSRRGNKISQHFENTILSTGQKEHCQKNQG